jgi:hypothetical protein
MRQLASRLLIVWNIKSIGGATDETTDRNDVQENSRSQYQAKGFHL